MYAVLFLVPLSPGAFGASIEGIWQSLEAFRDGRRRSDPARGHQQARARADRLADEPGRLRALVELGSVILLDYETNIDVEDLGKPLARGVGPRVAARRPAPVGS
ncbi:MAG: hypothetical protein R6X02_04005 [Enhygromyxa sp.]